MRFFARNVLRWAPVFFRETCENQPKHRPSASDQPKTDQHRDQNEQVIDAVRVSRSSRQYRSSIGAPATELK
jgi:hypothetical protein